MIIRVYEGQGASRIGAGILAKKFRQHLPAADVAMISDQEMNRSASWEKDTSVLAFGAGTVRGFKKGLTPSTLDKIRHSIEEGAFDYIGICAGAALATGNIAYTVKEEGEIRHITGRGLSLVFADSAGPCRTVSDRPYSGDSENLNVIAVERIADNRIYNAAHWGGPSFIQNRPATGRSSLHSISRIAGTLEAVTLHKCLGQGQVTICSHHPEIDQNTIGEWAERFATTTSERSRIRHMSDKLDGTAFPNFLKDARLLPFPA